MKGVACHPAAKIAPAIAGPAAAARLRGTAVKLAVGLRPASPCSAVETR
jgi:hypothetical protein